MATPNFSALLPELALRELNELTNALGVNRTQVVIRAIHQLHQQEKQTMNEQQHIEPEYKPTKKNIAAVRRWWKAGKNIWEISQLTELSESEVMFIVRNHT